MRTKLHRRGKWRLRNHHGPIAFALTRQNVPIFEPSDRTAVEKGAYVLKDFGKKKPDLILDGLRIGGWIDIQRC